MSKLTGCVDHVNEVPCNYFVFVGTNESKINLKTKVWIKFNIFIFLIKIFELNC